MENVTVQKDDSHKYSRGLLYMREKKFSGPGDDATITHESVPILPTTLARLVVMPDGKTVNEAISETKGKISNIITDSIPSINNGVSELRFSVDNMNSLIDGLNQTVQNIENKVTIIENNSSGAKIKTFDTIAEYQAAQSGGQIQPGEIVVIKG